MARTQLNKDTFTAIVVSVSGILQARSGIADIADTATPANNDFIRLPNGGSMPVSAGTIYGRGVGYVVTK